MALKVFHVSLPEELIQRLQIKASNERRDLDLVVIDLLEHALISEKVERHLNALINAVLTEKGLMHPRWPDPPILMDEVLAPELIPR